MKREGGAFLPQQKPESFSGTRAFILIAEYLLRHIRLLVSMAG